LNHTEKSLKDTAIIYSYPRSGLHLLIVGLYMLDGNNPDLSYDEIWGSNKIPTYTHMGAADFWHPGCVGRGHALQAYERHILLLRNPCSHYSSVAPEATNTLGGAKLDSILPDPDCLDISDPPGFVPSRRARHQKLQHLLDQGLIPSPQQVGSRYLWDTNWTAGIDWYTKTIRQFDRLRPWEDQVEIFPKRTDFATPRIHEVHRGIPGSKKMVVYYEDLVQDKETLLEVADFIGIKYGEFGRRPGSADFDLIRQNAKRLYLEKGWLPSSKITLKEEEKKELLDKVRGAIGDDETFDKYYKRYT